MSKVHFYNNDWRRLLKQHPLIARKIEELRCEVASYEEFEELRKRVDQLEKKASPEVARMHTQNSKREVKNPHGQDKRSR